MNGYGRFPEARKIVLSNVRFLQDKLYFQKKQRLPNRSRRKGENKKTSCVVTYQKTLSTKQA